MNNHNIRIKIREWLNKHEWDISATFTFADPYSAAQASKAVLKFWGQVDYYLYGNASRRKNIKCERVMFLEGDGEIIHHHYHAAIKCPDTHFATAEDFCNFLHRRWIKVHPRHVKVEFKSITDKTGWISYSTKEITHKECDKMDVYSSHIAATQPENVRDFSTEIAA